MAIARSFDMELAIPDTSTELDTGVVNQEPGDTTQDDADTDPNDKSNDTGNEAAAPPADGQQPPATTDDENTLAYPSINLVSKAQPGAARSR